MRLNSSLWITLVAGLALWSASCTAKNPTGAAAIPIDTTAVGAIDLTALRAAPGYGSLPVSLRAVADPLHSARELVAAWNGKDLLLIATGDFKDPPAGYTWIGKGIAAAGSAERLSAARQALNGGEKAKMELPASEIRAEVRAAVLRDGRLPSTGNLENLGKMLRMAQVTTMTAYLENTLELDASAQCRSIDEAQELEQSFRAMVTLAASATKDAAAADVLRGMRIERESMIVRLHLVTRPEMLLRLF
jgi:hypothetical protein